jgi:hypothetical protein
VDAPVGLGSAGNLRIPHPNGVSTKGADRDDAPVIDRLFVVVGAGASHGCAPARVFRDESYTPPLVPQLFTASTPGYADVLAGYPLAKLAAADLRGRDTAIAIEQHLRTRYRDSEHLLDRRIFEGIGPYLQELLFRVSRKYTRFPQNYESLVTSLLRLKEVVFVSLNYDLLLDDVLASTVSEDWNRMSWYIQSRRHWSLVKLHGSVNWAVPIHVERGDIFVNPPASLERMGEPVVRNLTELWDVRGYTSEHGAVGGEKLFYPVLSVPIGQDDELTCPEQHVEFLRDKLDQSQPIHLLLIGYSGNDREVLALIRASGRGIKTLTVVDRGRDSAVDVIKRLAEYHGIAADDSVACTHDFNGWIESGGLTQFVEDMAARPF